MKIDGVDVELGDETLEEEVNVVSVVRLEGPDQLNWCQGGQWW